MVDIVPQPDGSAQITVTPTEIAGLQGIAAQHLPFLKRAAAWFTADVAPELHDAVAFTESLVAGNSSTLTVSAPQAQSLRGMLNAHVPEFQQVLAVVESPAVRALLNLAKALL